MRPTDSSYLSTATGEEKYLGIAAKIWWKTTDYFTVKKIDYILEIPVILIKEKRIVKGFFGQEEMDGFWLALLEF